MATSEERSPRALRVVAEDTDGPAWTNELQRTQAGAVAKTFGNACKILRHTTALWYDEMRLSPMIGDRPVLDADIGRLREELFPRWGLELGRDMVSDAVCRVADEKRRHPVREYLRGLRWDCVPYLGRVPHFVLGIPDPTDLQITMLRRWAISAVARVMRPGCKVDTALVLVGRQGKRKSSFFDALAGGVWFSDSPMALGSKDAALQLFSTWIYEWPEIDRVTLGRYSASEVKAFLSQRQDTIRKPYARAVTCEPRHTVVVGSTNIEEYLSDETGSRRFWTVAIPEAARIDLDLLRQWRDQIWAEAVAAYDDGEPWWLTSEEDSERSEAAISHTVEDPVQSAVAVWMAGRAPQLIDAGVSLLDVVTGALKCEPKDFERVKHAACRALRWAGYTSRMVGDRRERRWFKCSRFV